MLDEAPPRAQEASYYRMLKAGRDFAFWQWKAECSAYGRNSKEALAAKSRRDRMEDEYMLCTHQQMLMPATSKPALRWKQAHQKSFGGCKAWAQAVARDELWLATMATRRTAVGRAVN